jgi:nuclear pore complex protein Nup205
VVQEYKRLEVQYNLLVNGQKQSELREALQQLLRWAWTRNKNLEEQAAQLHMLVGWSQLVEVRSKSLLPLPLVPVVLVKFVL